MAKYQFKGLESYARYLQKIGANTKEICGAGVYVMADLIANKVRENIEALPTVSETESLRAFRQREKTGLTIEQKKGLQQGFGISKMQNDDGYWNVKLGFDGYNQIQTKTYPKGQPNALIARAVESGSSIRDKSPFIRPAIRATTKPAIKQAMLAIDEKIEQLKGR